MNKPLKYKAVSVVTEVAQSIKSSLLKQLFKVGRDQGRQLYVGKGDDSGNRRH